MKKKCNHCGAKVPAKANFCPFCGNRELRAVVNTFGNGRFGTIVKAVLCAAAFLAVQFAVTMVYMVIESIRLTSESSLSPDELNRFINEHLTDNMILIGIISNLVTVAVFALYFLIRRKNLFRELGMRKFPPSLVPICFIFGYAMQYVLILAIAFVPWPAEWINLHNDGMSTVANGTLALVILGTAVVTGFAEETVFRVFAMERLGRAYGGGVCVIVSALLFGLAHMSPIAIYYATILGLILGCLYRRFRSVWPCAIVHMAFNLASILGLPDTSMLLYFAVTFICIGLSIISAYLMFSHIESIEE